MEGYFTNEKISDSKKRETAFQTLVAARDMLNLAVDKSIPITYEQAFRIIHDLSPTLFQEMNKLLSNQNENDELKLFKEMAIAKSLSESKKITVEELLDEETQKIQNLINTGIPVSENNSDEEIKNSVKFMKKRLATLVAAKISLEPRRLSENRIINRDYSKIDRSFYFAERIYEDDFFVDYRLPDNRFLRIRLLHPDHGEHITGADLIYEQIDPVKNKIRFLFLQYKTWDEKGVIYFSESESILKQINKMKSMLCDGGFCKCSKTNEDKEFRFPFCSAFWRPTDKLQNADSKLISTGYHIPVCDILKIAEKENKVEKKNVRKSTVTHKIFEELFTQNLIGSDWISISECEKIYQKKSIIQSEDRIRLIAREFLETP